jgi:hypothetical protein
MTALMQGLVSAGLPKIQLSNQNVSALSADPTDATAAFSLENDGDVSKTENGVVTDLGDWMVPKVPGFISFYECMATLNSGSLSGGTTGSWLGLGTTRSWTRSQTSVGASSANITVDIRRVGTTQILATCVVLLDAEVT